MIKLKGFVVTSTFLWPPSVLPPYHLPLYSQEKEEEAGIRGKLRPIEATSRWLCGAASPHSEKVFLCVSLHVPAVTVWLQVQASSNNPKPCAQGELRSSKMAI